MNCLARLIAGRDDGLGSKLNDKTTKISPVSAAEAVTCAHEVNWPTAPVGSPSAFLVLHELFELVNQFVLKKRS